MAVKAKAEITLSHMIDVTGTYKYYLLQSSTASAPAKPTTYPPASTWDDTEPTYTSGSTNSLYFVDCSVYSNNTFYYSPVSLSTSYEAAKEAYNKAVAAQSSAENTQNSLEDNVAEIREVIIEQHTDAISTAEAYVIEALKSYVETGNYSEFKQAVESELSVLANEISMKFTEATTAINNVDGDLQTKYNEITTYFNFGSDGLTIGKSDSPYKTVQTNDRYSMQVNGVEVLWIDLATKSAHIPVLTVTEKFTLLGYLIDMDGSGNVNCEYIGG